MKKLLIFTALLPAVFGRGVNGGMSCAVCTVLMGVTMQVAEIHEESILNATVRLCNYFPVLLRRECLEISSKITPYIEDISEEITPDIFCLIYGTCRVDEAQPFCHLFPLYFDRKIDGFANKLTNSWKLSLPRIDVCTFPIIRDICNILNNSYKSLDAAEDFDNDGFSIISTARGADWKGRDCCDADSNAHPGRLPFKVDVDDDTNCNGIWGMDNETNKPWEEMLCRESNPRGIIYIGDSIGAHFHMPQVWINPVNFDWPGFNISDIILDELDWPQYGFATGFKNITPNILIKGTMDSLYMRLRSRNRCNHRDYQNLSQNGASSFEGVFHAKAVSRNQTTDNPAIVIYAMQGNDVCNNFKDTVHFMTKPDKFRENIMETLTILNGKLPKDSHVVLVGLVHADFIYPAMAQRMHPIGVLHKNVRYKDLYNWFNCLQIGPCTGWLNSNDTLRRVTTQKAGELTDVLREIVRNERFDFFQLHFIENPINRIVSHSNVSVAKLLEAVDSLHPNQRAQPLLAGTVWQSLLEELDEDVLGPINRFNDKIKEIFGNQGGH